MKHLITITLAETLAQEMLRGQGITFTLPVAGELFISRFSLVGFTAALARTGQLCTGMGGSWGTPADGKRS
jgi:hypothetical protein